MALNEVDRVFARLVEVLAARGDDQILEPIGFPDLYQKILPYRVHRNSLRFDSNEDYEMALLRLLAGENGYVEVDPPEVAEELAKEARSVNPHPGAFRAYEQARAKLSFRAVKALRDSRASYAPPDITAVAAPAPTSAPVAPRQAATPPVPAPPVRELPFDLESVTAAPVAPSSCPNCSGTLPAGRIVNFCPHCGGNVLLRDCPQCGTRLDLDWRHCITCGYRVT